MEQQRRIHQHAHKLARPANRRIPSAHHSRDLVAHSPASPLNPRLIFGPIDNGDDSSSGSGGGGKGGGGSGSNSGTGTGANSPSHPGSSPGKPDPHSGDDPTTGSGDDSGDSSGTGKDPVTTSKSTPKPTQTSTSTATQTATPTATKTTPTATTAKPTSTAKATTATTTTPTAQSGPAFTFVVPSQSTAYVQVQPTTSTATLDNSSGTGENADASTGSSRAGPIIGIVAGVLVGIALISVIASFVFRKVKAANEDPYESDPFDGSEYQRHNETLPADNFSEDDHRAAAAGMGGMQSPDMTERTLANVGGQGGIGSPYLDQGPAMMGMGMGMGAAAGAYDNASITSASRNQSGGPRPPTMFARHLEAHSGSSAAAAAPPQVGGVYAPGEYTHAVVPAMPPTAATYNGAGSDPSMSPFMGPGVVMGHANVSSPYAHLDRARSTSSQYVDLDRSASGSSAGGGAPPPGGEYNRRSRQGVLDSMAEEGSGQEQYSQQQAAYAQQQQQQAYYNAGQAQQHDPYQQQQQQQYAQQQQQYQGQHQQQHPAQRAPSPDDDPYGGVY